MQEKYIDQGNYIHHIDKKLGQGGQGVVYRTKDANLAIKLLLNEHAQPKKKDPHKDPFEILRLLPIPANSNLSLPTVLLKDYAGYVMPLLDELSPLSEWWLSGRSEADIKEIPTWLAKVEDELLAKKLIHYANTGGLRERLLILSQLASLLAKLHAGGLVYADISPNNIFVSSTDNAITLWLIDVDNVRFETEHRASAVYTPSFGAPEVVQENSEGCSFRSDDFSFAVLAFQLLSLNHPFIGQQATNAEVNDWEVEAMEKEQESEDALRIKAYAGEFAFIDDPYDDSNACNANLPRELLFTDALKALFQQMFSQEGRAQPRKRPTSYAFAYHLVKAADITLCCSHCKMSYYPDHHANCPYCDTNYPRYMELIAYNFSGKEEWRMLYEVHLKQEIKIPNRLFYGFRGDSAYEPCLSISYCHTECHLTKNRQSSELKIAVEMEESGKFQTFNKLIRSSADMTLFWLRSRERLVRCQIKSGEQ